MKKDRADYDFVEGEILLIDKAIDWTSFDVVNYIRSGIRRIYDLKKLKVGHAGTLDPKATGLLIICTGKFTKRLNDFQEYEKEYCGTIRLGATTPSFDLETEEDAVFPWEHITEEMLENARQDFLGDIEQIPPAFSAIHIDGQRAYQFARVDATNVKLEPRKVRIHEIEFTSVSFPDVDFRMRCSKGTYIRSFARDLGLALGSGGYLRALRRTAIGDFNADNSLDVKDFLSILNP